MKLKFQVTKTVRFAAQAVKSMAAVSMVTIVATMFITPAAEATMFGPSFLPLVPSLDTVFRDELTAMQSDITASSAYTSLLEKDCVNDTSDERSEYFLMSCPGLEGFAVTLQGGDGRSWFGLVKAGDSLDKQTSFQSLVLAGAQGLFPSIYGSKLEWRYRGSKLVALIVRTGATTPDYSKSIENLVVLRINAADISKTCLIGTVDTKTVYGANTAARVIADDMNRPCL